MDNIQKYFYLICFTGYLREQSRIAMDGISEEEKKQFALTGGKCEQSPNVRKKAGNDDLCFLFLQ
jgi:hypothetical protein